MIDQSNMINETFGKNFTAEDTSVHNKIILSLTNNDVLELNEDILSRLDGEVVEYFS